MWNVVISLCFSSSQCASHIPKLSIWLRIWLMKTLVCHKWLHKCLCFIIWYRYVQYLISTINTNESYKVVVASKWYTNSCLSTLLNQTVDADLVYFHSQMTLSISIFKLKDSLFLAKKTALYYTVQHTKANSVPCS